MQTFYDNLHTSKAEAAMAWTKCHYYEAGNKSSSLLSSELKQEFTDKYIKRIIMDYNQYREDSMEINSKVLWNII